MYKGAKIISWFYPANAQNLLKTYIEGIPVFCNLRPICDNSGLALFWKCDELCRGFFANSKDLGVTFAFVRSYSLKNGYPAL